MARICLKATDGTFLTLIQIDLEKHHKVKERTHVTMFSNLDFSLHKRKTTQ